MTDVLNSDLPPQAEAASHNWSDNAPKGGRAVLNRMLKEGGSVPLFLGQTFIQSLRDVGYDSTSSAVCEHVDNGIQAGATEIRVYFAQPQKKGDIDVVVYDNGRGMPPNILKASMSFGGSMGFGNRSEIGRFGVGMKTAALSMGPVLEVYSWQEPKAIYSMMLDVDEIGRDRKDSIQLDDPKFIGKLPENFVSLFNRPTSYPKNPEQSQQLLFSSDDDVHLAIGKSGTIVFIPSCDRLQYKKEQTLVDDAVKQMARIYRRQLDIGLRLFVNNRRVEAFDPTFWMQSARHTKIEGLSETRSRLIQSWPSIQIPISEDSPETAPVSVRLYMLPIEAWYSPLTKTQKKDLQLFAEDQTISFMRNDREVHIGSVAAISGKRHADTVWMRIQIDFPGELDEAFGVAMNKQGVRPKRYVLDKLREELRADISKVREKTAQYRAENSKQKSGPSLGEAERRANQADPMQGKALPAGPTPTTDEERKALEGQLRSLAVTLKRHEESDEDAYQRIKTSTYITFFKHDDYWPFYHVDLQLGKVILTINTAHPFFSKLYEPLNNLITRAPESEEGDGDRSPVSETAQELLINLQLLLLSLARAQGQMTHGENADETRLVFDTLRREWSTVFKTQLMTTRTLS